jgi:hypothetical protein
VAAPTSGVVTGTFPNLTYTPTAGFVGTDSLTYSVTDPSGAADTATVTFVVTERNDPPVPVNQVVNLFEDTAAGIVLTGSDPEGGAVTLAVATGPAHGTLAGSAPNVTYTPAADYHGPDSFTFTVTDDAGHTATGTVQLNVLAVNDAPVAGGTSVTTAEDTAVSIALPASDVDNASADLVVQATSLPAHGTLSGSGANLTYTPAADFHGTDSFTYRVRDPQGATSTGTVWITVTPVNDAPTANARSVSVLEDGSVSITLTGHDTDADAIGFAVASGPDHGTITGTGATVTYVPAADYHGFDSFTFTVSDGNGGSSTATITIAVLAVNDAPAAQPQSVTTDEDTPIAITLAGTDPDGDTLSYTIESGPTHGTLSGTAPALTYTPNPDYAGPDSFTFRVGDPHGATSTATVSITVDAAPLIATTLEANPAVARLQGLKWYYPVLSARLTETASGAPLAGRLVHFFVQGRLVCNAITAADGTATCGGSANSVLLAGSYSVRFDGDHDHSASSATGTVTT